MMEDLLHNCLFPVMLGCNTACHACVRQMEKRYGVGSTVLTGKRALTLRFWPFVTLVNAPPVLSDDVLLGLLGDISEVGVGRVPLLVLCDEAYRGFVVRNRESLETRYILRNAAALLRREANYADW